MDTDREKIVIYTQRYKNVVSIPLTLQGSVKCAKSVTK